jgi:hypothetical protein
LSKLTGKEKHVVSLPNWLATIAGALLKTQHFFEGKEGGLDPIKLIQIQTAKTFFDPTVAREALGFNSSDLDAALQKTVEACK